MKIRKNKCSQKQCPVLTIKGQTKNECNCMKYLSYICIKGKIKKNII